MVSNSIWGSPCTNYAMSEKEAEEDDRALNQIRTRVVQLLRQYDAESDLDKLTIVYAASIAMVEFMEGLDVDFESDIDL